MTINAAQFRANFTEFANTTTYPDADVNFWLGWAVLLLDADRWGNLLDLGLQLFTAYMLAIEAANRATAAAGGIPGAIDGPLTQQAVDKVSMSQDVGRILLEDAGFWNANNYGTRFWMLLRRVGAGPIQIGAGGTPPYPIMSWW